MEYGDHLGEDALTLLYYGELTDVDERAARAHLDSCQTCRREHDELLRLFALVDNDRVPEPRPGFEARAWHRLEPSIATTSGSPRTVSGHTWRTREWFAWPAPMRWTLAGALALIVIVSFVAGRWWERAPLQDARAPQAPGTADVDGLRERVLLSALGDHLDRSEGVIVELATAAPATGVDISAEQRRAADLLASTRLYRRAAVEAGDRNVAGVLEALERMLVEVTMSPATPDAYELAALQARIEKQELLFKLRVASLAVREREGQPRRGAVPAAGV